MLQQAYLARQNSEKAFSSLDEKVTEYQKAHQSALSYALEFIPCDSQELISIASHFASFGYDVECNSLNCLIVDWRFAQKGLTGKIYIHNSFCHYTKDASFQDK